eukprot:TRINITY_DN15015_c0_g1_i1.p1 TRINITY_DN15015_c0_g1~~TRINITY_DN15015_c0_g1_i1.p1  ORF type:complete len:230 (+),score=41.18 TRINITY_DN15015_c0_g1_i1:40-729(+)
MTYVPAYCSTFYAVAVTGYGSSYALGVGYERSPNSLKYQKPVFFSDNAFARWNDNYVPVLLVGSFVTSNTTDFVRSVAELSLLLFPAARELGTLFSVTAYMACGIAATLSWRLQSNINLEKNQTIYDRNIGTGGAICGLAGALLLRPNASLLKNTKIPALPFALAVIGERAYSEYAPKHEADNDATPVIRQWGGLGGAIFGGILAFTTLRRRSGAAMKQTFQKNFKMKP